MCLRCFSKFQNEQELTSHVETKPICEIQEQPQNSIEGITEDQELKLRKKKTNMTEPDRWKEMYEIIFPGEPVPEPCKNVSECTLEYSQLT
jgi:hypothetical protein